VPFKDSMKYGVLEDPSIGNYQINYPDLASQLGLGTLTISSVIWDSRDIGLQVFPSAQSDTAGQITMSGSVAADTAEYPMLDQYRVRNRAYWTAYLEPDGEAYDLGNVQDDVIITSEGPVLSVTKSVSPEYRDNQGNVYSGAYVELTGELNACCRRLNSPIQPTLRASQRLTDCRRWLTCRWRSWTTTTGRAGNSFEPPLMRRPLMKHGSYLDRSINQAM